jgi:hypothetical protein
MDDREAWRRYVDALDPSQLDAVRQDLIDSQDSPDPRYFCRLELHRDKILDVDRTMETGVVRNSLGPLIATLNVRVRVPAILGRAWVRLRYGVR